MSELEFQEIWEEKYSTGHKSNYPWDIVVSFVFRNRPKAKEILDTFLLEVGFGTGNNLWFAAREGFQVSGIEASKSAVAISKKRLEDEGLRGDLRQGSFTKLPFQNDHFDMAFDRHSLACVNKDNQMKAIQEIRRCLNIGGKFLFTGYSDMHTSMQSGSSCEDGFTEGISEGSLVGVGKITFISMSDINKYFKSGWNILSVTRVEKTEFIQNKLNIHSEWHVIAEKK